MARCCFPLQIHSHQIQCDRRNADNCKQHSGVQVDCSVDSWFQITEIQTPLAPFVHPKMNSANEFPSVPPVAHAEFGLRIVASSLLAAPEHGKGGWLAPFGAQRRHYTFPTP